MKEYYILLDNKNTPIKDYTDEMLFEISLYPTTLDEAEVYATTENGLKEKKRSN